MTALISIAFCACIAAHSLLVQRLWKRLSWTQRAVSTALPGVAFLYALREREHRFALVWTLALGVFAALLLVASR
jgi:hypothetical protein